jgi:hypothetical protein
MTSRLRLIPLFALLVMLAACSTSTMLEILGSRSSPVSFGILLGTIFAILALLAILEVSGLLDDLIRGITRKVNGTRDIGVLVTIGIGLFAGVLLGVLLFQVMALLSAMFD